MRFFSKVCSLGFRWQQNRIGSCNRFGTIRWYCLSQYSPNYQVCCHMYALSDLKDHQFPFILPQLCYLWYFSDWQFSLRQTSHSFHCFSSLYSWNFDWKFDGKLLALLQWYVSISSRDCHSDFEKIIGHLNDYISIRTMNAKKTCVAIWVRFSQLFFIYYVAWHRYPVFPFRVKGAGRVEYWCYK